MNKVFIRGASTMNYLFLRQVSGYEELNELLTEEMQLFLQTLSTEKDISMDYFDLCVVELGEGSYMAQCTIEEFELKIKNAIEYIFGESNEHVFSFYSQAAKEARRTYEIS